MPAKMRETAVREENGVSIRAVAPIQPDSRISWRLVYYPPGAQLCAHRHDVAQFSTLLCGQARETTRRGDFESDAMLMEFKPAEFEHANEFGPDGALILSINMRPDNPHLRECLGAQDWTVRPGRTLVREWTLLSRNISNGSRADKSEMETATIDLLAALTQPDDGRRSGNPPRWLVGAREAILETDEDVEAIAQNAGVHRVHLSRSFRRYYGCSITDCRREARLSRAMRLLAYGGETAGAASYAAGFADQSHLTRAMRRHLGVTPVGIGMFSGA